MSHGAVAGQFTITPIGPFSLAESATFGFGQRDAADFDGVMRMAFCLDDFSGAVAVEVRQSTDGDVPVTVIAEGAHVDLAAVERQVARVLSLADDATGFVEVGTRDPVVAQLLAAAPGLRPPLFHSPYEAAAWSVLSARRPHAQMAKLREEFSAACGTAFIVAGQEMAAFPTPAQLLAVDEFAGLPAVKLERLHAVAAVALDGWLDADTLRTQDTEAALTDLQRIPGIGPFYAQLILLRSTGVTDLLPSDESRVREIARDLYGLTDIPTVADFDEIARPWSPWRTWVTVLMRAAGRRVLGGVA